MNFLLISIILVLNLNKHFLFAQNECNIFAEIDREYLYASKTLSEGDEPNIFTWQSLTYSLRHGEKYVFYNNDPKGVWIFESVPNIINSYYLKNVKFNEYLYAKEMVFPTKEQRRLITKKLPQDYDEAFIWQFDKLDSKGYFNIWNLKYKEIMFAKHYENEQDWRRKVYTLNEERLPMGYFNWIIKCKNDNNPNFE